MQCVTSGMVDIHGGGNDLCFPHHENEMAQSVAMDNNKLANYWMHNGMLNLNSTKMSKSLGNVFLTKDFISQYGANVLRLGLLQTHYRNTIDFTDELIESTKKLDEKISNVFKRLSLNNQLYDKDDNFEVDFYKSMDDDFNTPNLITELLDLIKLINIEIRNGGNGLKYYDDFNKIIYILGLSYNVVKLSEGDKKTYLQWELYRKQKDFENADMLRYILEEKGII